MPISGIVIDVAPQAQAVVAERLQAMKQVELQPERTVSALVAVLDTPDFAAEQALVEAIQQLDGVAAVRLAYHNFEDVVQ